MSWQKSVRRVLSSHSSETQTNKQKPPHKTNLPPSPSHMIVINPAKLFTSVLGFLEFQAVEL